MARSLNFRQLEAFAAVIAAGSITEAAQLLERSQSVVTRLIQDLEATLGYPLLYRNGPRITPTERGVRFHVEVERHLVGLQHLRERADAIGRDARPAIEVAAILALAVGILPRAVARLPAADMPHQIYLRSISAEEIAQAVAARTADLGVTSLPINNPALTVHWIAEAPCVAVLRADDELAADPVLSLRRLAGKRVISIANPFRLRHRVTGALRRANVTVGEVVDTNTSLTAMGAVRAGLGVALIEPVTPMSMPVKGLVHRPLDVDIPFYWGLVTATGIPIPPVIHALMARIEEASRECIPGLRMREPGYGAASSVQGGTTDDLVADEEDSDGMTRADAKAAARGKRNAGLSGSNGE